MQNLRIEKLKNLSLAALLMAGAAFAACSSSSDDSIIEQPTPQPVTGKYTMTVNASKGDGEAATRALTLDEGTKTLSASWAEGEKVIVYKTGESMFPGVPGMPVKIGTLEATDINGASCTLTGDLDGAPAEGETLQLVFPGSRGTEDGAASVAQDGTLATIQNYFDRAHADVTVTSVNGTEVSASDAAFVNEKAIVKFILKNGNDVITPSSVSVTVTPSGYTPDDPVTFSNFASTYTANGNCFFYAISGLSGGDFSGDIALTATVGDKTYTYEKAGISFTAGQYYEITVKMFDQSKIINLSNVKASELINATLMLNSGDVLTGTLDGTTEDGKVKIEIAAGATVTLHNAHINGQHYSDTECRWAGITCLGDAIIVLSGENTVTNFNRLYPAILAAHNDTGSGDEYTLIISGTGKLTATNAHAGAAIGGGYGIDCGNIEITGGTITANGGGRSAAIGGGEGASCGSITISGGTVTATVSTMGGAGIGSGNFGSSGASCGDITISGTASVTATGGSSAAGIGSGGASSDCANTCGNISISGPCTVNATGNNQAAGIGTGEKGKCGYISINGGTVTAQGGSNAAGIGCGKGESDRKSECGAITIKTIEDHEADFTSVTAIRGLGALHPIGHCSTVINFNTCGTITFGNTLVYTAGNNSERYSTDFIRGLNFEQKTTDLGGEENYTNNTWKLWR